MFNKSILTLWIYSWRKNAERRPQPPHSPICILYQNETCRNEINPHRAIFATTKESFLFQEKKLRGINDFTFHFIDTFVMFSKVLCFLCLEVCFMSQVRAILPLESPLKQVVKILHSALFPWIHESVWENYLSLFCFISLKREFEIIWDNSR